MSTPEELAYFKDIFLTGFWLVSGFNLVGLMIRVVRMMRTPGGDFNS